MIKTRFGLMLAVLLVVLTACAAPSAEDCALTRITTLPITRHTTLLTVPVGINGQWVTMLVDTGAERTVLTEAAASRLKLPRDQRFITRSGGVGGITQAADARVESFVLGGVGFPIERVAINPLGPGIPFDGLLGADILLAFDLDIDPREGRISLYRVRRCPYAGPPWTEPAVEITGVAALRDRLMVPLVINSVAGMALLDTGAQTSAVGASFGRRLGLVARDHATAPVLTMRGVGPGTLETRVHQFRDVQVGPVAARNIALPVLPTDMGFGDALLGQDFLLGRRVFISFPTRRLFISQHGHERLVRP
jgi:predicted aspartyl protease